MEFRLESYGLGDDRVLRYLNGAIIKETPIENYFTLLTRLKKEREGKEGENEKEVEVNREFLTELNRLNCSNWNLTASTICMASTVSSQKELPLEWDESKIDQMSGYTTLSKIKAIFDNLNETKNLQLSHTVSKQESKTLKYSIFNRNEKLEELSQKTLNLSKRIGESLEIQTQFLEFVKEVMSEFKVMVSQRNPVDLTSQDVDYPTSFTVNVVFFDVFYNPGKVNLFNYNSFIQVEPEKVEEYDMEQFDSQDKVWDLWELHNAASPYAPQQCLFSCYESDDQEGKFAVRLTFPQNVSHFVEKNYTLSVNSATLPLFTRGDSHPLIYHLRRARACLIDRFIFLVLAQYCYCNVKAGRHFLTIGDSSVFIKYISSESVTLRCEEVELEVSYRPSEEREEGETVWKLLVAKLREIHVKNWKLQRFLLSNQTHNLLGEFLKYAVKVIRYRRNHLAK